MTENAMMTGTAKVLLAPGATMPRKAHKDDVGYDVTAKNVQVICRYRHGKEYVHEVIIDTGVCVTPPAGYHFEMVPNSRLAKCGLGIPNGFGVIDPGYTGSMRAIYRPMGSPVTPADIAGTIAPGKVCAQLVLRRTLACEFEQVESLADSERGDGGFGSTAGCGIDAAPLVAPAEDTADDEGEDAAGDGEDAQGEYSRKFCAQVGGSLDYLCAHADKWLSEYDQLKQRKVATYFLALLIFLDVTAKCSQKGEDGEGDSELEMFVHLLNFTLSKAIGDYTINFSIDLDELRAAINSADAETAEENS